jgi:hypothetical protein
MRLQTEWIALLCAALAVVAATARAVVVDRDWESHVQNGLASREYWASESGGGLQAPNRAHEFRTRFAPTGIRVESRSASASADLLSLSLAGVGRGAVITPAPPAESVVSERDRVEIRRQGIVEWYVNAPRGLEQGFTLTRRPAGEGALVLELAVAGARPTLRGGAIVFDAHGRRLRYGNLEAVDAGGRVLAAHLAIAGPERLRLVIDDAGAVWPIVVDPLLESLADAQLEANQAAASFGYSVAGAGDVNGDGYDDVIVGAIRYDAGQTDEGAAFIFHGSASGLGNGNPATAATQIESNQINAFLGWSVGGAGDVNGDGYDDVIVGARNFAAGQTGEGAAFVFLGSASGIADGDPNTAAAQLEANQAAASFGYSVAGAGDVNGDGYDDVIVGARNYASGQSGEGGAFVFLGSALGIGDGNPSNAAAVLQGDQSNANFGHVVDGAGDVNGDGYDDVIVGAPNYDAGQSNEGAAFVFLGSASGVASAPASAAATQLEGEQISAALGTGAAGAGDVNGDGYDDVIASATLYDAGETDEGAAFVFHGSPAGIADATPATAATQLESNVGSSEFGASVAGVGDVTGDGYSDVVVGATGYTVAQFEEGAAFLFAGGPSGVADSSPSSATVVLRPNQASALMGYSVAGAGDVNGDGGRDLLVGAIFFEGNPEDGDEGAVFVYHGVPAPEPGSASLAAAGGLALLLLARRRPGSRAGA